MDTTATAVGVRNDVGVAPLALDPEAGDTCQAGPVQSGKNPRASFRSNIYTTKRGFVEAAPAVQSAHRMPAHRKQPFAQLADKLSLEAWSGTRAVRPGSTSTRPQHPRRQPKAQLLSAILILASLALIPTTHAQGDDIGYRFAPVGREYHLTLQDTVGYYFRFEASPDLSQSFTNVQLALGDPRPTLVHEPAEGESQFFFRFEPISVFAPRDTDRDGMDDLWELTHDLNPLDARDAGQASPNIAGISNLEEYRRRFGLNGERPQFYSREVSLFNFGAPTARFEAISREQSVFNFGSPPFRIEAMGRELSIFNGERPPTAGYPEAYSREVSLYNFGAPPFRIEALGREVSVFNGERPAIAGYPEAYSREVSLFNFGAPIARVEAISRELSVFNDIP